MCGRCEGADPVREGIIVSGPFLSHGTAQPAKRAVEGSQTGLVRAAWSSATRPGSICTDHR